MSRIKSLTKFYLLESLKAIEVEADMERKDNYISHGTVSGTFRSKGNIQQSSYSDDTYPEDEASAEAETWNEMESTYIAEGIEERTLAGIVEHWEKVFDTASDMERFKRQWNALVSSRFHLNTTQTTLFD